MFNTIISILSWIGIISTLILGLILIYGAVRKEPPFKPGTEPKHYWDMTRAERDAQQADQKHREQMEERGIRYGVRRRDEATNE